MTPGFTSTIPEKNCSVKQQVKTSCGSGTDGCCCICARQMLRVHSPDGSTFPHEMISWPPLWMYDITSKIGLR